MKPRFLFKTLYLLAVFSLFAFRWGPSSFPDARAQQTIPESHRLIVKFRSESMRQDTLNSDSLNALMAKLNVRTITPLFPDEATLPAVHADSRREFGFERVYILEMPESTDMNGAVTELSADPGVEYAEIDHIGYGAVIPNDVQFPNQWSLHNTGQNACNVDADIDAAEAWGLNKGKTSTVIAVIDTGVDLNHPDLTGKTVAGYDYANNDSNPMDDHGHGTHVSGISAALSNNNTGITGICWNCKIMPLKALNASNWGYYSWWTSSLVFAADHGASVINMSMGGTSDSVTLHDAIRYAYNKNIPVAVAMMNDGNSTPYYPAHYPEVIAVGSTDCNDARSSFSNYGNHIDVVAPGSSILSSLWNNTYASWSGTSMATPHVTGVIGLIRSVNPNYSVPQILNILKITAEDQVGPVGEDVPGWDPYFGGGRLNAYNAVQYTLTAQKSTFKSQGVNDGLILESSESGNTGGTTNNTSTLLSIGDGAQDRQYKAFLSFNTAVLPNGAVVTKAQLKIQVQGFVGGNMFTPTKTLGNLLMDIRKPYFGTNASLTADDFQFVADSNGVGVLSSIPGTGWHTVTLKSAAYPFINLTGTTQFRLRFQKDDNDDLGADYLKVYSGDAPVTNRPQLIVEYYVP